MSAIPLVRPLPLSILVIGSTGQEATVLRSLSEAFSYHTEIHWVGSRAEAIALLNGEIPTYEDIILSCHGDEANGGVILCPDEPPITPADIQQVRGLRGKTILNLGCAAATEPLVQAFMSARVRAYTAANGYVDGNAALFFALHYIYFRSLNHRKPIEEAVALSRAHDEECERFQVFLNTDYIAPLQE